MLQRSSWKWYQGNETRQKQLPRNTWNIICRVTSCLLARECADLLQRIIHGRWPGYQNASIGQAIVQATRPRAILSPLQLGLGIQMHHHFGSKFLIDTLHKLGFCSSYAEVCKYERSASITCGTDVPNMTPGTFVQYAADNVDHNICTLDGNNTFHGMGMIATVTPSVDNTRIVPRVNVSAEDIAAIGHVNIKQFRPLNGGFQSLCFGDLPEADAEDDTSMVDFLWSISTALRNPHPAWSGTMQLVHKGVHPGKSSVMFLPMIDMNPSDITCVYSTLLYVASHAKTHNVTPILTFDQPLWLKAVEIQESVEASEVENIVLKLGGFHAEMSFLGAIGHIMGGSGLQEVLECIYASNTVGHMLSGKAVMRAIRGHLLVSGVLNAMLVCHTFNVPYPLINSEVPDEGTCTSDVDVPHPITSKDPGEGTSAYNIDTTNSFISSEDLGAGTPVSAEYRPTGEDDVEKQLPQPLSSALVMLNDLLEGPVTADHLQGSNVLLEIKQAIENRKILATNPTAKLWLQYMEMIQILQQFIKAERTGNWKLHLSSLRNMLPFLAAAGHNNYTKSAYLYLQNMSKLRSKNPEVNQHFLDGLHIARRSDRYWAGLPLDLMIEQVLMRSVKTTGGLTRGRGMSEIQHLVWLLSRPACSEVNLAMQDLLGITYQTSVQHKDLSESRQEKDHADSTVLMSFIAERNPFKHCHWSSCWPCYQCPWCQTYRQQHHIIFAW